MSEIVKISETTACQPMVYAEFPAGFKSAKRFPDRDQIAVVPSGTLRVAATEDKETYPEQGEISVSLRLKALATYWKRLGRKP